MLFEAVAGKPMHRKQKQKLFHWLARSINELSCIQRVWEPCGIIGKKINASISWVLLNMPVISIQVLHWRVLVEIKGQSQFLLIIILYIIHSYLPLELLQWAKGGHGPHTFVLFQCSLNFLCLGSYFQQLWPPRHLYTVSDTPSSCWTLGYIIIEYGS